MHKYSTEVVFSCNPPHSSQQIARNLANRCATGNSNPMPAQPNSLSTPNTVPANAFAFKRQALTDAGRLKTWSRRMAAAQGRAAPPGTADISSAYLDASVGSPKEACPLAISRDSKLPTQLGGPVGEPRRLGPSRAAVSPGVGHPQDQPGRWASPYPKHRNPPDPFTTSH